MGRKSQSEGAVAERLAECAFSRYQARGRLTWNKTYPEVKVLWKGRQQQPIFTGQGAPDYALCLNGGRLLWLEIKTWTAQGRHTTRRRLHQYRQMLAGVAMFMV